jgi:chromosome segregation ATPase
VYGRTQADGEYILRFECPSLPEVGPVEIKVLFSTDARRTDEMKELEAKRTELDAELTRLREAKADASARLSETQGEVGQQNKDIKGCLRTLNGSALDSEQFFGTLRQQFRVDLEADDEIIPIKALEAIQNHYHGKKQAMDAAGRQRPARHRPFPAIMENLGYPIVTAGFVSDEAEARILSWAAGPKIQAIVCPDTKKQVEAYKHHGFKAYCDETMT